MQQLYKTTSLKNHSYSRKHPNYTVDYFLHKFHNIPDSMWCSHVYLDEHGRCDALGLCGVTDSNDTDEATALRRILSWEVTHINAGHHPRYQQETPKTRILAALHAVKQFGRI